MSTVALGNTHKPLFMDQMNALYMYYAVLGSICKVKVLKIFDAAEAAASIWPVGISVDIDESAAVSNTVVQRAEMGGMQPLPIAPSYESGICDGPTIVRAFSTRRYFGTNDVVGDDRFNGTTVSNPDELAYYQIIISNMHPTIATTASITVYVQVTVDYVAKWTQRLDVA